MDSKYKMSISLNVLNHLGLNLYSSIPAVLSEIVANSWDADASIVNITINKDEIIIEDDGCGMSLDDINKKFLYVGHRKRETTTESAKYKRKYMGRKGIGKLSMFSIAKEVEIFSSIETNEGIFEHNALRMNVDDIISAISEEDLNDSNAKSYSPIEIPYDTQSITTTGTKIILRNLKTNVTILTSEYIKKRVARRFGIIGSEYDFNVNVNNTPVSISDRDYFHKLSYLWYFGDDSISYINIANNLQHNEVRENIINCNGKNYKITGWIGSVENAGALKDEDENLNKIVILVRGKLGQEDILSEFSEGGLYSKYLIGEINADFLDDDDFDDMATSNRQSFREDDFRFVALKEFIYNELKYIQKKWTDLRNDSGEKKAHELMPVIDTWFKTLKGDDKNQAKKMFGKINQIIVDDDKKKEILKYGILAFEKLRYTNHLSAIDTIDVENFTVLKDVFMNLDEIEATLYYQIVRERIEIIKKLHEITQEDVLERAIQEYLFNHLWLLDPSWERVEGSPFMENSILNALNSDTLKLTDDERKARLDLGYKSVAGKHVIIELKRANRIVKIDELVAQVDKYRSAIQKILLEKGDKSSFEILFVVGKPINNVTDPTTRALYDKMLEPQNCRIVYYNELIANAYNSYNEYLVANKKSQPLIDLFNQLQ